MRAGDKVHVVVPDETTQRLFSDPDGEPLECTVIDADDTVALIYTGRLTETPRHVNLEFVTRVDV